MLVIKKASEQEVKELFDFCKRNHMTMCLDECNDDQYMIAADGEIIGFSQMKTRERISEIKTLFVKEEERRKGIGDGLLRGTLNYIDKLGCQWVLIHKGRQEFEKFLLKEELMPLKELEDSHELRKYLKDNNIEEYYICNTKEFFVRGCKSSRR